MVFVGQIGKVLEVDSWPIKDCIMEYNEDFTHVIITYYTQNPQHAPRKNEGCVYNIFITPSNKYDSKVLPFCIDQEEWELRDGKWIKLRHEEMILELDDSRSMEKSPGMKIMEEDLRQCLTTVGTSIGRGAKWLRPLRNYYDEQ